MLGKIINNGRINEWAASFGTNVIVRYKYLFLVLIFLLTAFGFMGLQKVVMDSSNESFFPESDETIQLNDRFKEIFGNEEFVFVLVEADEIFDKGVLEYIRTFSEDLENNLPFAKEVVSLTNMEYMDAHDDVLNIDDLIGDDVPSDRGSLEEIKEKVFSKQFYVDRIITEDSKKTGIAVTFTHIPEYVYLPVKKGFSPFDEVKWPDNEVIMNDRIFTEQQAAERADLTLTKVYDPRKLITPALRVILARNENPDIEVVAAGIPVVDFEGERINSTEAAKFGFISLIVALILLIVIFRSVTGVIAPLIVIISTLVILIGGMGWLGIPTSATIIMVPNLILVISVSYSIHVVNHFQRSFRLTGDRRKSVTYAYRHSAWPCFVTAVTTAIGFASFIVVPIIPIRNTGITCAVGIFLTYLLVIVIVPAFFSFGRNKQVKDGISAVDNDTAEKMISPVMTKWADLVVRRALPIAVVSIILVVIIIAFSFKMQVNSDFLDMMGDRVKYVRDARHILERLGGIYSYEVFIELPEEGMAKDPDVLKTVDSITDEVSSWGSTKLSTSLNDIIKDLNMTMHNNDEAYYTIPDSPELVAQYLLLYEMSGGESVEDWVDYDYKSLRLSVQVGDASTDVADRFDEIISFGEKRFPQGTKVSFAGQMPMLVKMVNMIAYGQVKSVLVAIAVITVMMMLILRSVRIGLISMIPNMLPILVITGLMGLLGFPLDIMTVMILPMIIGIAVDDTVHYIIHFKQEFHECRSYREANRRTFGKVGRAIVFTSVILTIGFSILGLSTVKSAFHMAVLAAAGIISALLADLFVTPMLFVFLKPLGKEEYAESRDEGVLAADMAE